MKKNSSDIIVNFSNVTKQYGDLIVLDNLNLEIKARACYNTSNSIILLSFFMDLFLSFYHYLIHCYF